MPYIGLRKFPRTVCWVSLLASNKNNSDLFFKAEEESCQELFILSVYTMRYIYIYVYMYIYIYIHIYMCVCVCIYTHTHSQITVLKPHWMLHKIAS